MFANSCSPRYFFTSPLEEDRSDWYNKLTGKYEQVLDEGKDKFLKQQEERVKKEQEERARRETRKAKRKARIEAGSDLGGSDSWVSSEEEAEEPGVDMDDETRRRSALRMFADAGPDAKPLARAEGAGEDDSEGEGEEG